MYVMYIYVETYPHFSIRPAGGQDTTGVDVCTEDRVVLPGLATVPGDLRGGDLHL
jgi:hypothetical protein